MKTELKFIGQYNASICGSNTKELIDVFYNNKDEICLYRSYSNGDFHFEVIDRNDYNSNPKNNKFDSIISDPKSYTGMSLFVAWRQQYVDSPNLMPMRYYEDILLFYKSNEIKKENILKEVKKEFKKFELETINILER